MKKALVFLLALIVFVAGGCGNISTEDWGSAGELILVTTTSTYDSGLLDYLLPYFAEKHNYDVKVIPLGTGQALEQGKNGDADVALVHAKATELEIVEQGHFVDRKDVMYNDFIIVGPDDGPLGIKELGSIKEVFAFLTENQATFVSRGDDSGTHKKELALWQAVGLAAKGSWYVNAGAGMGDTLRIADEKLGYTMTDRATYLALQETLDLVIVYEGAPELFNQYGIMAVNPDNYPDINYEGAKLLIDFFVSEEGQELIREFKPFGGTLFFPNAE